MGKRDMILVTALAAGMAFQGAWSRTGTPASHCRKFRGGGGSVHHTPLDDAHRARDIDSVVEERGQAIQRIKGRNERGEYLGSH